MNGIDKIFRARVEEWLQKEHHNDAELAQGALMVLQCNRNRAMYNTMMRKPSHYEGKMAYELKKHLAYLQDGMNLEEMKDMEKQVMTVIDKVVAADVSEDKPIPSPAYDARDGKQTDTVVARGKRTDHDTLPEAIRAIWNKNAERYKKMKQAHETCKTLTAACDRYEYTKAIAELWADYKKDFDTYDHYVLVPGNDDAEGKSSTGEEIQLSADDLKAVNAARPYISKYLPKLLDLVELAKGEDFTHEQQEELELWRNRIQQRIDVLVRCKQVITDELKAKLMEADITLKITDTDEQGQEHPDDTPAAE